MIKIICKECKTKLPIAGNGRTVMNSTFSKKGYYPSIFCPKCGRTLVEGKPLNCR